MLVGAAAAYKQRLGGLDRADVEVEGTIAVGVEGDYGAAVRLEVETVQERPFFEHGFAVRARSVSDAVSEPAIALDAGDARALAVEGLRPGDVVVPVGEALPPELELAVVVAAVSPHAVGRVDVGPGVVVEVRGHGAPVPARVRGAGAGGRVLEGVVGLLQEERIALRHRLDPFDRDREKGPPRHADRKAGVLVEEIPLRVRAGRVKVEKAVAVEIRPGGGHAVGADSRPGLLRDVLEAAAAGVAVEVLEAEVVRDEKVRPPVPVVVGEERRERPARRLVDSPGGPGVGEMAVPVVDVEAVGPAVVGVVGRVGHLVVVVARHAHEEVEVSVAVHVGEGGRARVAGDRDAGRCRDLFERPVAAVSEETGGAEGVRHEEVRKAVPIHVAGGDSGGGDAAPIRRPEAGRDCDVREEPAPVVPVQDRAHSVGDEEVLETVAVEV